MIAALYVMRDGCYYGLPDVDPWDEERDARLYAGPWPVVAHPPCARWCRLAGLVQKRWGYRKGDDGGCFEAALRAVRTFGGVLEHPAYSEAFYHFDLPIPEAGPWQRGLFGGWSCRVDQWHYGHRAKKATWLYAFGADPLPSLVWTRTPDTEEVAYVTDGGGRREEAQGPGDDLVREPRQGWQRPPKTRAPGGERNTAPFSGHAAQHGARLRRTVELMGHHEREATPPEFRDLLLSIARSAA